MTPGARDNLRKMLADATRDVRAARAALSEHDIDRASSACARLKAMINGFRWTFAYELGASILEERDEDITPTGPTGAGSEALPDRE